MHVAYVTVEDPSDLHHWSGLNYFIRRALEINGASVEHVGPLRTPLERVFKVKQAYLKYARRKNYHRQFEPALMRAWGRRATKLVEKIRPDVVVAPGSHHVLELQTDAPVVIVADANFACAHNYYDWYTNLGAENVRHGHRMSRLSLERSAMTIYASDWAAKAAIDHYGVSPAKVRVVPFGANLFDPPTSDEVARLIELRPASPCRLLYLGVEWKRKGGDLAVEVARLLNEQGLPTELHVVGCKAEIDGPHPPFIREHGFISKSTPEGRARIERLIGGSHFLILPSSAEAYGLVYCEAAAYGVPSLGRRTGGVPIVNGTTGWAFDSGEGPEKYAVYISSLMRDDSAYRSAALRARSDYVERLNWSVAGAAFVSLLEETLRKK